MVKMTQLADFRARLGAGGGSSHALRRFQGGGWGQGVSNAGLPPKGEVSLPKKACSHFLLPEPRLCLQSICSYTKELLSPCLAASLEDSHFWKSLLCHRSLNPLPPTTGDLQAQPICHQHVSPPSGRSHYPPKGPSLDKGPGTPPMAWAHTKARRNKVSFKISN